MRRTTLSLRKSSRTMMRYWPTTILTLSVVPTPHALVSRDIDCAQPITKRRIALLRSLGRTSDAVSGLTALLDFCPVDAESWAELAEIYFSQGMYPQAIYSLEEVLVLAPNAWNVSGTFYTLRSDADWVM